MHKLPAAAKPRAPSRAHLKRSQPRAIFWGQLRWSPGGRSGGPKRFHRNPRSPRCRDTKEVPEITDFRGRGGLRVPWRDPTRRAMQNRFNLGRVLPKLCRCRIHIGRTGSTCSKSREAWPEFVQTRPVWAQSRAKSAWIRLAMSGQMLVGVWPSVGQVGQK